MIAVARSGNNNLCHIVTHNRVGRLVPVHESRISAAGSLGPGIVIILDGNRCV